MVSTDKSKLVAEIAGRLVAAQVDDQADLHWWERFGHEEVTMAVALARRIVEEAAR